MNENMNVNIASIREQMTFHSDIRIREFSLGDTGIKAAVVFVNGLADRDMIDLHLLKALMAIKGEARSITKSFLLNQVLAVSQVSEAQTIDDLTPKVLMSSTALLVDGWQGAIMIDTTKAKSRDIEEPISEALVRGPRAGFNENMSDNTALLRRHGEVDNRYRTLKILPPMSLMKLEANMNRKSSYLLQNIIAVDGEVKFSGAAVIKGKTQKFAGRLSEEELLGVTWLSGKGKGGAVKSYEEKTNQITTYEVERMKSKIHSYVKGEHIKFHVNIESEGRLIEKWTRINEPNGADFKKRAEQAAEKEVQRLIKLGLNKIQKDYKADVIGFGKRLNIEHPKQWQKVKNNWDDVFSQVLITYSVKLTITDTGAVKGH